MQTEAEKYLIYILKTWLKTTKHKLKLINLGAAQSTVIENELETEKIDFICDRSDIQDCHVQKSKAENNYTCSLEDMSLIPGATYDGAFANFVLEHITNPEKAAQEMARILKPGGKLALSLSNPQAPEFILAKFTPTSFHQFFREDDHDDAYPVKYAYKNIKNLIKILEKSGFKLEEDKRFAFTYGYLYHFPILNYISKIYDYLLTLIKLNGIMSHSVLILTKEH